ncbi:MAG: hypothetical protein OMM_02956 [Candidatus Magnetoglobus multicellularis str. Araruama]|uniref:Sulfatase-modifying factor enzyme-like domain-containing protein n=1 Tax=Candidatus Magnetoglobus multicellularis str. Araruama TaxID=890399 RepID=A0A1V1P7N9_9BACT|nr:MAG: hypothetical protein OMM_02956 [Candidatus Magnetoglobus multicellularis str. Araruama]
MAGRTSHIDHLPLFYDALFDFINQLQIDGHSIGIQQYLNVQELIVTFAADNRLPLDPKDLQSYIGPILCNSPEEQLSFDHRYDIWVKQFRPTPLENEADDMDSHEPHDINRQSDDIQPAVTAVQKRGTYWKKLFWGSGSIIAFLLTIRIVYQKWETIVSYGAICGMFMMILITLRWIWWNYEAKQFLSRRSTTQKVVSHAFFVDKPSDTPFQSLSLIHTAQEFRRHYVIESQELDIYATIEKSIQQGGWFSPVKGMRKVMPEYLALIERNTFCDHQSQLADSLLDVLTKQGVYITHFYYDKTPLYCFPGNDRSKSHHLLELIARYPSHRLMIFSSGEEMINPLTDQPKPWIDTFNAWETKSLMTFSDEQSRYGNLHPLAETDFIVIPATEAGFRLFIESTQSEQQVSFTPGFQDEIPERFREDSQQLLHTYPPDDDEIDNIIDDVKQFTGKIGFEWFAACAIYPELQWHLTLYIGINLTGSDHQTPLFNINRLTALSQLPWFRHGSMPDWLRKRLIADIPVHQERKIRQVIQQLLITASHSSLQSFKMTVAEPNSRFWSRFTRQVLRILLNQHPDGPIQDYIFLKFMSDSLSVRIPKLLRLYFKQFKKAEMVDHQSERIEKVEQTEPELTATEELPEIFTNSIGMTFRLIQPGKFMMGEREVQHEITITTPFYMGTTTVTQHQWKKVMGNNPSFFNAKTLELLRWEKKQLGSMDRTATDPFIDEILPPDSKFKLLLSREEQASKFNQNENTLETQELSSQIFSSWIPQEDFEMGGDLYDTKNRPVERVSWNDAQKFIKKLNQIDKTEGYRLPFETEWEYSCRAGSTTDYCFGNFKLFLQWYALFNESKEYGAYPVASLKPNNWGLYDMHGNVWEWCQNFYNEFHSLKVSSDLSLTQYINEIRPGSRSRVLRGGSYNLKAWSCRSANRYWAMPGESYIDLGFRLVFSLKP